MKSNINFFLTLFVVSMTITFFSCSSDDGDGDSYIKISEEAKLFQGAWTMDGAKKDYKTYPGMEMFFFQDGKVKIITRSYDHYGDIYSLTAMSYSNAGVFDWNYNMTTQQLTTNSQLGQWQISLITDNSWVGTSTFGNTQNNYIAKREKNENILLLWMFGGIWTNTDSKDVEIVGSDAKSGYLPMYIKETGSNDLHYLPDRRGMKEKYGSINYDLSTDTYIIKGNIVMEVDDKEKWFNQTYKIVHPYSYEGATLEVDATFTNGSSIKGTYKRKLK